MQDKIPEEIRLNQDKDVLMLVYAGEVYELKVEYLRVLSPSAEVRGHGAGQSKLQTGKRGVTIRALSAVGNYALKINFSDGHDTGLYDWDYLYQLSTQQQHNWADYMQQLQLAGASREPS